VLLLLERILGMRLGLRLVVLRVAAVGRRSEQAGREHRREHSSLKNEEEANAVDKSVKHSQQNNKINIRISKTQNIHIHTYIYITKYI
jgi:hypothetical protein